MLNLGKRLKSHGWRRKKLAIESLESRQLLTADLVSWWKGEGNYADSAGINNAIRNTVPTPEFQAGQVGQAFVFNGSGSNNYLTVPTGAASSLNIAGDLTLEAWVKLSGNNFDNGIVNRGDLASSQGEYAFGFLTGDSNRLVFRVNGVNGSGNQDGQVVGQTSLNVGQWYHIAAVYDANAAAADSMMIFVNGVLDGTSSYSGDRAVIMSTPVTLGAYYAPTNTLNGNLDEVKIYRSALTAAEVVASMHGPSDFGDAPAPYATLIGEVDSAGNRAPYTTAGYAFLGSSVTTETNGTHSSNASADTGDDGVNFTTTLERGVTGFATVAMANRSFDSRAASVAGWIDFNQDGVWDATEKIFEVTYTTSQQITIPIAVPANALAGTTYARFRVSEFSTQLSFGPYGFEGAIGEIEDYQVTIMVPQYDFGDAPAPYPTTLSVNGARHLPFGPMLGSSRDSETDSLTNDGSDEDGIAAPMVTTVGKQSQTIVIAATGIGRVDAWIDFNGDGSWGGPGEQIFNSVALSNGDNTLTFSVPSDAKVGTTYARFRLSTIGGLGVSGVAPDGEVEDYSVQILPATSATGTGLFTSTSVVPSNFLNLSTVYAADLDGDGDTDSLTTAFGSNGVAWQANDGQGNFGVSNVIATISGPTSAVTADIDGDGDLDVLVSAYSDHSILWYKNVGRGLFIPGGLIDSGATFATRVYSADVDADGDMDVLAAAAGNGTNGGSIRLYVNDGESTPGFSTVIVRTGLWAAYDVSAADVNSDGRLDILAVSLGDNKISWYENLGGSTLSASSFTTHDIANTQQGVFRILAVDIDRDGDTDIVTSSITDNRIAWYVNDGLESFSTVNNLDVAASGVRNIEVADLDGDNDYDVLASLFGEDKFVWYANDGSQSFTRTTIESGLTVSGAHSAVPADIDGDGDLDILAGAYSSGRVKWYRQTSPPPTLTVSLDGPREVAENGVQPLTFRFDRTGSLAEPLTVTFNLLGSARPGVDYSTSAIDTVDAQISIYSITIPANSSFATVTITPIDDLNYETDESVFFSVVPSTGYVIGSVGFAFGTILNDDPKPSINVAVLAPSSLREDSNTDFVFQITRSGPTDDRLFVGYNLSGTATPFGAFPDYRQSGGGNFEPSGFVFFEPGQSTTTLLVHPVLDGEFEPDETIVVTLSASEFDPFVIGTSGSATATIVGDGLFWTGAGDGVNWNDPANWSSNSLPTASDHVFIPGTTGTVHVSGPTAHVASIRSDRRLAIDSSGVLEVGGDVQTLSAAAFEFQVAGTLRVVDDAHFSRLDVNFVGQNGPTANQVIVASGKTLTVEASTLVRSSAEGAITGAGTLHNAGRISPNLGTFDAAFLQMSVGTFINDGVVETSSALSSQTLAKLAISSNEFRNYGSIQIGGVTGIAPTAGVFGLSITSTLFVNAGHLITGTQGAVSIQATNWRNWDVVGRETWYGWINNQGLMDFGGALDNAAMTLLVGPGQALLSGSIQGGNVRRSLTRLTDPQSGQPIAVPPLHNDPLRYGLVVDGGAMNVIGQSALLSGVDMGTVLVTVDAPNVLNVQGTISFGSRSGVGGLDNVQLSGDLHVAQDATLSHAIVSFTGNSISATSNVLSIASGKTLVVGADSIIRSNVTGSILGAGALRNLGTINPNIAFGGATSSLQISVSSFINDGLVSTSQVIARTPPAGLAISSNEFRNYGSIQISGVSSAPPAAGQFGLSITSTLFVNAGHLITDAQGAVSIQATNWRNSDVVGRETWYGWINNQGLMDFGGALDNSGMALLVGPGQALLSGSIVGGAVRKSLNIQTDPETGQSIAAPPLHKNPGSYGTVVPGGLIFVVGQSALLDSVDMGSVGVFVGALNTLKVQGLIGFAARNEGGVIDNVQLEGDLQVNQDAIFVGGILNFYGQTNAAATNRISIASGKTFTLTTGSLVRSNGIGTIVGAGTLHNIGTINPNAGLGGPPTEVRISVSNLVNDGVLATSTTQVGVTPAKLTITSNEFRNYGSIQINGLASFAPAAGAFGLSVTSTLFVNAGHLITDTQGAVSIQAINWRNSDSVGRETWFGWINNQGLMEFGGALDNDGTTLLVGPGKSLLSGSISGGNVRNYLTQLVNPQTGQPIAAPPLHSNPLGYGLLVSGGQLLPRGQDALLNGVDMGSAVVTVGLGETLRIQGTVSFSSGNPVTNDNLQLAGELRVDQDATIHAGIATLHSGPTGITVASGKTLTVDSSSVVRSAGTGLIEGAGTLRNLGTFNPNGGLDNATELTVAIDNFVNDGLLATSLLRTGQTPARLIISSNTFRNNGTVDIHGTLQASNSYGLSISSVQLINSGAISASDNGKILLKGATVVDNFGLIQTGTTPLDTVSETRVDVVQFINHAGATLATAGIVKAASGFVNDGLVRSSTTNNVPIVFSTAVTGVGSFEGYEVDFAGSTDFGVGPRQAIFADKVVLQSTNTAKFQLAGTAPGSGYDQYTATQSITLGGDLAVSLNGGFLPKVGDRFVLLQSSSSIVGSFAHVTTPSLLGRTFSVIYSSNTVELAFEAAPIITVTLPAGPSANNLVLRRRDSDAFVELVDLDNGNVVVDAPVSTTQRVVVIGQNSEPESLLVDYNYGGYFVSGVEFNAGTGTGDALNIKGTGTTAFDLLTPTGALSNGQVNTNEFGETSAIQYAGIEPLSLLNALTVTLPGTLNIGNQSLLIDSSTFTLVGQSLLLSGGTVTAPGGLYLSAARIIQGFGAVVAPLYTDAGSTINATGNLILGDANALDGVEIHGRLNVRNFTVTLQDAHQAILGSQTTIGTATANGNLIATHGILVGSTQSISGRGTISTPGDRFVNQGFVQATVTGLTFTDLVTGAGSFAGNVTFSGGTSFGNSPTLTNIAGNAMFASSNTATVEIGGTTPGTSYDKVVVTGNLTLGGNLVIQTIDLGFGYTIKLGDTFVLFSAAAISGTFANVTLPTAPTGGLWRLTTTATEVVLSLIPAAAPTVASAEINGNSDRQRSAVQTIKITFSSQVNLLPDAIEVRLVEGVSILQGTPTVYDKVMALRPLDISVVNGQTVVTIRFADDQGRELYSLGDGKYKLQIFSNKVIDLLNGKQLDGDANGLAGDDYAYKAIDQLSAQSVDYFYRLYGDYDGDRDTDNKDFLLFSRAFGSSIGQANYAWYFDVDGNGSINAFDRDEFVLRRNRMTFRL